MKIKQSRFITSAVKKSQYPTDVFPQIAFVGRSNVGKSSLINSLTNIKKLAKVSSTPGKTRLINFFLINEEFYLVDLPGYGYARVSKEEKKNWGKIIEDYLIENANLKKIVLLVDSRHKPTEEDVLMYNYIKYFKYETLIIATKSDKISKSQFQRNINLIRTTLKLEQNEKILIYSSLNKNGRDEIIDEVFQNILEKGM